MWLLLVVYVLQPRSAAVQLLEGMAVTPKCSASSSELHVTYRAPSRGPCARGEGFARADPCPLHSRSRCLDGPNKGNPLFYFEEGTRNALFILL